VSHEEDKEKKGENVIINGDFSNEGLTHPLQRELLTCREELRVLKKDHKKDTEKIKHLLEDNNRLRSAAKERGMTPRPKWDLISMTCIKTEERDSFLIMNDLHSYLTKQQVQVNQLERTVSKAKRAMSFFEEPLNDSNLNSNGDSTQNSNKVDYNPFFCLALVLFSVFCSPIRLHEKAKD